MKKIYVSIVDGLVQWAGSPDLKDVELIVLDTNIDGADEDDLRTVTYQSGAKGKALVDVHDVFDSEGHEWLNDEEE